MKNDVPTFETDRLILRPIQLSDAEAYEAIFVDYEVVSQLAAAVPWPYPKGGVAEYLSNLILPEQGVSRWAWGIFSETSRSKSLVAWIFGAKVSPKIVAFGWAKSTGVKAI